jgi:SAM-dependent methyltransferase
MTRAERLLAGASQTSRIIEIGAGYSPVAPKSAGWQSHVVDHASRQVLCEKYRDAGVDLSLIEEVDTIWQGGPLHAAVPAELCGRFDVLIASHVIEHMPDLVDFLVSAERLLGPAGVLSLAVPDRRYCFDYFKPATLTGDVLEAHAARRSRHTLRTAWNHVAYSVKLDGALACGQHPVARTDFIDAFATAAATQAAFGDDAAEPYVDYHVWCFTPAGFALVILELGQLGLIDWRIDTLHGPEQFEFFVVLRRGAERIAIPEMLQDRRMALLRQQLRESRDQIDFALADNSPAGDSRSAAAVTAARPNGPADTRQLDELTATVLALDARLREVEAVTRPLDVALSPLRAAWHLLRRPRRAV